MLKNYLKITFRSLMKNKLFTFINVFGLGVALACCIVAYLNWDYNVKFDTHHLNSERIYRINFIRITNGQPVKNGDCPMPLGSTINGSISQIDEVMRFSPVNGNFKVGDELFRTWVSAVDPNFFDMFTFDIISGSKDELKDKSRIFISTEIVEKHFPDNPDPLGELITYINGDQRVEFIVGGVFKKQPLNSSFFSDAYVHYENVFDVSGWDKNDWSQFNTTFITVNNPDDVPEVERQLQQYVEIQNRAKEDFKVDKYYLDPFVGMAIRAEREDIWNHWFNNSLPVAAAVAPGIMAILILLIACFNFTNTSIAIANRRIKEIGIRKVMGSSRKQLIAQFLGENILLTFIALIVGLLISTIFVPAYSAMWPFLEIRLDLMENIELLGFLFFLLICTGIFAGSYPALYVSAFQPTSILRGTLKFGGTNNFTRILLTLQYAISLIAIISGFIFAQNAEYQRNYDMGFDMESIVYAYVGSENRYDQLRNEITDYPLIKEMAGSTHCASDSWYTDPIKFESSELDVSILDIGDNYLNTINATILKGRDFIKDSQNDVENSIIINQELVRILGWEEPVGQRIILKDTTELYVVGVVKDIYIDGELWDPLEPMVMRYTLPENYRFLSVKADLKDIREVHDYMNERWKMLFPDELSTVRFMDATRADSADVNNNIKIIFVFLGIVATILSAIGLFSLVSLNVIKKMKEIGVRKVMGASILNILNNISREFVIIFIIASILGSAAAYFLANALMASIWTYYVPIGAIAFIVSIMTLLIISSVTIGGKVLRAASMNPAHTLRDE
jgi:ABC-type antimicrobial peptide transport system permease subunit